MARRASKYRNYTAILIDEGGQDCTNARIGPSGAANANDAMSLASVLVDDRAVALVMLFGAKPGCECRANSYTWRMRSTTAGRADKLIHLRGAIVREGEGLSIKKMARTGTTKEVRSRPPARVAISDRRTCHCFRTEREQ